VSPLDTHRMEIGHAMIVRIVLPEILSGQDSRGLRRPNLSSAPSLAGATFPSGGGAGARPAAVSVSLCSDGGPQLASTGPTLQWYNPGPHKRAPFE
jgi:hypothetical protein